MPIFPTIGMGEMVNSGMQRDVDTNAPTGEQCDSRSSGLIEGDEGNEDTDSKIVGRLWVHLNSLGERRVKINSCS